LLLGVAVVCGGAWLLGFFDTSLPSHAEPVLSADPVDDDEPFAACAVGHLPAGAVVQDGPPAGWSHLVIKLKTRIAAGDESALSAEMRRLTTMFFVVMAADVVRSAPGSCRLREVRLGQGTAVKGTDTLVSCAEGAPQVANLSWPERMTLHTLEKGQDRVQLLYQSADMAIIDAPTLLYHQGKHQEVSRRYALVLDAKTGALTSFLWAALRQQTGLKALPPVIELPPGACEECAVHVDRSEVRLGIPSVKALAMVSLPAGVRRLAWPSDASLLEASCYSPGMARRLRLLLQRGPQDANF
jgi:hypothetical protein